MSNMEIVKYFLIYECFVEFNRTSGTDCEAKELVGKLEQTIQSLIDELLQVLEQDVLVLSDEAIEHEALSSLPFLGLYDYISWKELAREMDERTWEAIGCSPGGSITPAARFQTYRLGIRQTEDHQEL